MSEQNEQQELADLVKQFKGRKVKYGSESGEDLALETPRKKRREIGKLCQWTTCDNRRFVASGATRKTLPPGAYEIHQTTQSGLFFEKINVRTEGLIRFPQTNSEKVLKQIDTFWKREPLFKEYQLAYKRGILLWGPAGSGKSCLINLIMKDVVEDRNGIVIKFTSPGLFMEGMRELRQVQPQTPIVVLMEDLDSILENNEESQVLNILDGVEIVKKMIFLATTNYPELLGPRIVNRPSRFDKRFKIDHPNAESRMIYFKHLCGIKEPKKLSINLEEWVKQTEGFSIAHLKELFVAVVILGDSFDETLKDLELMRENISSEEDTNKDMNLFTASRNCR